MHVSELQTQHISKLLEQAEALGIENANRFRKQDLVFAIVRKMVQNGESFTGTGTLEILSDGFGFLRSGDTSYLPTPDDIYVSPNQIRRFNLHTGDTIEGSVRTPKDNERYFALTKLDTITAMIQKFVSIRFYLKILRRCFLINNSFWNAILRRQKT